MTATLPPCLVDREVDIERHARTIECPVCQAGPGRWCGYGPGGYGVGTKYGPGVSHYGRVVAAGPVPR